MDMGPYEFNQAPRIAVLEHHIKVIAYKDGANPNDITLGIRNCGSGTLDWELTEDYSWLTTG